jgi:hypothetical protein
MCYAMLSLLPMSLGKRLRWRATRLLILLHTRVPVGLWRPLGDAERIARKFPRIPTLWRSAYHGVMGVPYRS